MAKYERNFTGDFDDFLYYIESSILKGSLSAHIEDGSDYRNGTFRCSFRVFERYSMLGKNRVSLSVALIGQQDSLFLSAIAAGGSQAVLFKINTFGEEFFLDTLVSAVEKYIKKETTNF